MRYEIEGQEKSIEPVLKLRFKKHPNDSVVVCGEDNKGFVWELLELELDGTFCRVENVPNNIGLQTDEKGRVKES